MAHSYLLGCAIAGLNIKIVAQKNYWPDEFYIKEAKKFDIKVEITDNVGAVCRYGPKYLFRLIETEPEIVSPQQFNVVSSQPVLKWNPLQLSFLFMYRVEIYLFSGYQITIPAIRTYSDISSTISEFQISKSLESDFYLWTVYAVDQFGNWSRSKPATFQVGE